jgi:hypothetical protein
VDELKSKGSPVVVTESHLLVKPDLANDNEKGSMDFDKQRPLFCGVGLGVRVGGWRSQLQIVVDAALCAMLPPGVQIRQPEACGVKLL